MSGHQSHLSDSKYGYDLVVATTQDAIDMTMQEYLSAFDGTEFIACYTYNGDTGKTELKDHKQIQQTIGGDPFAIPNGADQTNASLKKLYDLCRFQFAFKAKMGIPPGLTPENSPDIVVLDQGSERVTYHLYFAEFVILVLEEHFGKITWRNLTQPADQPWMFQFVVTLGQRTDDKAFEKLPKSVQDKLNNLNPDSAFSVQQLYLDLNTAGMQDSPTIPELDKSSDAYLYLTRIFLNTYWEELKKKGDVLLGYTVLPKTLNPNSTRPSLIPTAMDKEVSPYRDVTGQPMPTRRGLYTLDYLVMSNNRVLPPSVQFGWNWIEDTEKAAYHGVMAVRKGRFAQYLREVLSPELTSVCFKPWVQVLATASGASYDWRLDRPNISHTYDVVDDRASKVLTFKYSDRGYDEAGLHGLIGWMSISSETTSEVQLEDNLIKTVVHIRSHVEVSFLSSDTVSVEWIDITIPRWFQVSVSDRGALTVSVSKDSPAPIDKSEPLTDTFWGKLVEVDREGWMRNLNNIVSQVRGVFDNYEARLQQDLNNQGAWVFPGGKTFTYKEIYFSDHTDLISHITYVDPS